MELTTCLVHVDVFWITDKDWRCMLRVFLEYNLTVCNEIPGVLILGSEEKWLAVLKPIKQPVQDLLLLMFKYFPIRKKNPNFFLMFKVGPLSSVLLLKPSGFLLSVSSS